MPSAPVGFLACDKTVEAAKAAQAREARDNQANKHECNQKQDKQSAAKQSHKPQASKDPLQDKVARLGTLWRFAFVDASNLRTYVQDKTMFFVPSLTGFETT